MQRQSREDEAEMKEESASLKDFVSGPPREPSREVSGRGEWIQVPVLQTYHWCPAEEGLQKGTRREAPGKTD